MDDEKLIECVRRYEFIFNLKHPKYMDTQKKDIAWKEIASQLKHPAAICKQRWQCLRDSYRRALNKKKGKSAQAAKNCKPWRYEKEMAFVVPYFMERKSHEAKITSDDEDFENGDENYAIDSSENLNNDIGIEETDADVDVSAYNSIGISDDVVQTYHNKPQQSKANKKAKAVKRKAFDTEQSTSATLMTTLLDDRVNLEPSRGPDELDRFFLNISDTVKKFPPYHQALAKNRIFTLVSEMELEQLAPSSSTVYAYSPSLQLESSSTGPSAAPMLTSPDNCDDHSENFPHNFTEIKIERQSM